MKIGYPAAGMTTEKKMYLAKNFIEFGLMGVFDTQTQSVTVIPKELLKNGVVEWVKNEGITTIITPEIKAMALKVFREEGVDVYKAEGQLLSLNVQLLLTQLLNPYTFENSYNFV